MRLALTATSLAITAVLIGCVPQAEYDQLMFENRSLAAEKEAADQRALDAEASSGSFRRQLQAKERELYPKAIQLFAEGRLKVEGRHVRIT